MNDNGEDCYCTYPSNDEFNDISTESYHAYRSHPTLVSVVEELGEDANGKNAELDVIEIPDDVE